jgi:hypothetical protein
LGYRQRAEFLKTDSESLFPGGSKHFSNFYLAPFWAEKKRKVLLWQKPVFATAKPLGSELLLSRQVFSAQDGARQTLKLCSISSQNELSKYVFKILDVVCSLNSNIIFGE